MNRKNTNLHPKIHILLVDADTSSLLHNAARLEEDSYEVTTIEQQAVALSLLRARGHEFDAVIADVAKQDMDCITFLRRMKIIKEDLPVILMSSKKDVDLAQRAFSYGAILFVDKPIDAFDVINLWQHVIREKRRSALENQDRTAHEERANLENGSRRMNVVVNQLVSHKHVICDPKGKGNLEVLGHNSEHLIVNSELVVQEVDMAEGGQLRDRMVGNSEKMDVAEKDKQGNPKRKRLSGDEERGKRSRGKGCSHGIMCIEDHGNIMRSLTSGNKPHNMWNAKFYRRFKETIHGGREEISAQKISGLIYEPNGMLSRVANNMQQLSYATRGICSERNNTTRGVEPQIGNQNTELPCLGGPGRVDTTNATPFPLIPVASLGVHVPSVTSTDFGILRRIEDSGEVANTSLQTSQLPRIDNYSKVPMPSYGGLGISSFKPMASSLACNLEATSGLQFKRAAPLDLVDRIKKIRKDYGANQLGRSLLSNIEAYTDFQLPQSGEFNGNVPETGGGPTNIGFLHSNSEPSIGQLVGEAAESYPGIQIMGVETTNNEHLSKSSEFLECLLSENINYLLEDGMDTEHLDGSNGQLASENVLMNPKFHSSYNPANMDQANVLCNGNQFLHTLETHAPTTLVPSTGIQNIDPSYSTYMAPAYTGFVATEMLPEEFHGFSNQPIIANINSQSQTLEIYADANTSFVQKFDAFNSDEFHFEPQPQDGTEATKEDFGLNSEDFVNHFQ